MAVVHYLRIHNAMRNKTTADQKSSDVNPSIISKSKFLGGLQCPKLLWTAFNAKHLISAPDAAQQAIFDQGHEVGSLAKQLFPGGVDVGAGADDFDAALMLSSEALKLRKPVFEASFSAKGGYCRVDILKPAPNGAWDVIEVKSTTSAKDVHLPDLAFQAWVLTGAGLKIRRCSLMHIDGDYVRQGPIDPKKFFTQLDMTAEIMEFTKTIGDSLKDMAKVIRQTASPEVRIGPHCDDPYTCPLHDLCWAFLPEQNVTTLYRGGKKTFQLLDAGITKLADIPDSFGLNNNQSIQQQAAITGKPHIERPAIMAFVSQLEYPLSFMDFETFGTGIPLFDGVQPYQQVPFQYSLHIVRSPGAKPEHFSFLATGQDDPRPEFMHCLHAVLPEKGSVIVYNASFEKSRLEECCGLLPKHRSWYKKVEQRIVDLLLPFRGFRFYAPEQLGSASIKAVLPALTGRSYKSLEIQEGGTASLEFLRITFTDVPENERQKVRQQLEEYCGLDTEGMVWIVDRLRKLAG